LEFQNRIIADALTVRIRAQANGQDVTKVMMTIADFDGVTFQMANPDEENPTVVTVSIKHHAFHQFEEHGATAYLGAIYGDLMVAPADGYDVTLQVDFANLTLPSEELIKKVASLKRNLFAAVYGARFSQKFTIEDAIGSHACSLEALPCV
jgi:actin related protein 2/3 complex subunit 2